MSARQQSSIPTVVLVLLTCSFAMGCSGEDDPSTYDSPTRSTESYVPTDRPGGSRTPSGVSCTSDGRCPYWYCHCQDGGLVNAYYCDNGACLASSSVCEDACQNFDHGSWSGAAEGGVWASTPTPDTCAEVSEDVSSDETLERCARSNCCTELAGCYGSQACLDYWDCLVGFDRATCDGAYGPNAAYWQLADCLSTAC